MSETAGESRRQRYLRVMQVDVWLRRERAPGSAERRAARSVKGDATPPAKVATKALAELEATVAGCRACDLHHGRTQTVFGTGDVQARCMIIGEAPGAEEDARGEPFVGRAGQLLNAMLRAIGLSRDRVYIANIIKCRPPRNRDPKPQETAACSQYMRRQITLVNPRVILAVGRVAAQHLVGSTLAIGRMRGQSYFYQSSVDDARIPIVVTYHPAYLLRSPLEKRKSWQDLKRVRQLLESCH